MDRRGSIRPFVSFCHFDRKSFTSVLSISPRRSTLKCDDCGHESVTFEPFWAISVPIPKKSDGGTGLRLVHVEHTSIRFLKRVASIFMDRE